MTESARDRLKDIISEGLAVDIFYAEEAFALDELVRHNAGKINEATFGAFFGSLQVILGRHLILSVSRLFEPEKKNQYKVRSIPAAIKILHQRAGELVIEQRLGLLQALPRLGLDPALVANAPDQDITALLSRHFDGAIPQVALKEAEGLHKALDALKTLRDKVIAHPEAVKQDDLPKATLQEIRELVEFAKLFVSTIGFAYLSTVYADDSGRYSLSSDAGRASRCLNRILQAAGVLEKRNK